MGKGRGAGFAHCTGDFSSLVVAHCQGQGALKWCFLVLESGIRNVLGSKQVIFRFRGVILRNLSSKLIHLCGVLFLISTSKLKVNVDLTQLWLEKACNSTDEAVFPKITASGTSAICFPVSYPFTRTEESFSIVKQGCEIATRTRVPQSLTLYLGIYWAIISRGYQIHSVNI